MHLKARICQLGVIHNRCEKHGEEEVPAIDVPITGFALTAEEFNGLLVNPFAHRALFDTSKNPAEPVLTGIKPLGLKEKFHEAHVTLHLGLDRDSVKIGPAKIAKVKFDPATGGLVSCDFTVQAVANLDDVPKLLAFQGHEIECEINVDPSAKPKDTQSKLALDDEPEDGEGGDEDQDDEDKPRRGRKKASRRTH